MAELDALIAEAEKWRQYHKARGAQIEALAASIRIKALKDARASLNRSGDGQG